MARWLLALALATCAVPSRTQVVQRPSCPDHAPQRCTYIGHPLDQYSYIVDGVKLLIKYTDSGYFAFECPEKLTLDNSALPRFKSQLRVKKVRFENCPSPHGSYAAVLAAFNVHVLDKLTLVNAGNLTSAHLANFTDVLALELTNVTLAPGTLSEPAGLHRLFLDNVRLPPGELHRLPRTLKLLDLTRTGTDVPADVLEGLPDLVNLSVRDSHYVNVAVAGALHVLALDMPNARVSSALLPALSRLVVFNWAERKPAAWTACALDTLSVRFVSAEELPANWVSECTELRVLSVEFGPQLSALHATSLHRARNLQELVFKSCRLTALPTGLLDHAKKLRTLDLSGNLLKELPGGLFVSTTSLQTLDLSKNRLTTNVYTSLSAVTSLTSLILSNNDLKDSCGNATDLVRGVSPLQSLQKLTILRLKKTNTSLMCRDWRETMPLLETLDLSENNFISVTYADLQFRGSVSVTVHLEGNDVTSLQYTQHDHRLATAGAESSRADSLRTDVTLGGRLACDCGTYWAARALRERPEHGRLRLRAACADGRALGDVPPADMLCAAPALCAAAPGCTCARRPSGRAAPRAVLRVRCVRAGVRRVRDVLAPLRAALLLQRSAPDDYDWQLQLAHNRIAELDVADLPKHVSIVNLTDNALSEVSADAARALLADGRRVWLARNPLDCHCRAADTLQALHSRQSVLQDYASLTCANGSLLAAAPAAPCAAPRGLGAGALAAGAALVTLLAAGALAGLLWHPALRLRLKAWLHRRGWLPAAPEADDDARRFDVFLSFSHGDERFVRDELVARLESGAAPYRLCVHYRDWAPGGWIPAQIAASVRASRRTVAVVSAHFLRSAWARAEFREAYALALRDARPRLVVVLLDDPAALPLDDRLRRYLATNTYVRWGDPWFWQKLYLALPRGRGPAPARLPVPAQPEPAQPEPPRVPAEVPEVCSEPPASSLNSATSSSSSDSSSSSESRSSESRSADGSAMELARLMTCGAPYAGPAACVPVRAVPV